MTELAAKFSIAVGLKASAELGVSFKDATVMTLMLLEIDELLRQENTTFWDQLRASLSELLAQEGHRTLGRKVATSAVELTLNDQLSRELMENLDDGHHQ